MTVAMMMERLWQRPHILPLLSLFLCFVTGLSEKRIEWKREGEKVDIPCSAGRSDSPNAMYLYKTYDQQQEVTYLNGKFGSSPRKPFGGRIQIVGDFTKLTATITNLTIDDTGVYWCQYLNIIGPKTNKLNTDGHVLVVVSGQEICPTPAPPGTPGTVKTSQTSSEVPMSTMLVVCAITIGSLVLLVLIILIIRVKRCCVVNGKYRPDPQAGVGLPEHRSDSVYEAMRPQRATSMSQSSGQVLINPAYTPGRGYK
ncbi:uncharacterized protein si:rp71-81e14.2 [Engraulis encrasicolus]|uniref:uncharacterized protein si:rp71-81e14.2 n=1 Tax=Engraulis encrasicolus TaxID=184585 RepID=UPI002FCF345B